MIDVKGPGGDPEAPGIPVRPEDAHPVLASLAGARFDSAEALLAGFEVQAVLAGVPLPSRMLELRVWLCFWQGRFEEAARHLSALGPTPGFGTLRHVLAWARGELPHLSASLCPALGDSGLGDGAVRIASAERLLASDRPEAAVRMLGPPGLWRSASPLARVVAGRIRASAQAGSGAGGVSGETVSVGASGIDRWGLGRTAMQLLHAIPSVLELINDADDELAALGAACAWGRRHCGADLVVFLAADDGRVIAGEGWKGSGLSEEHRLGALRATTTGRVREGDAEIVFAPVRYAGTRIGAVLLRGDPQRQETLTEGALTMAALSGAALRARLDVLSAVVSGRLNLPEILGVSPAIAGLRDGVARSAATPFSVLIEGESGTGKELVARALHRLSPRRDRRFAAINCAALSDELIEAELFGHSRGAFTGAVAPRAGLFEDAHGGSLFLDEVGELSPRAQAKLLRVLQEREVRRVGENASRPVDARVIAATNKSLAEMAARGAFRDDLLFRLAVVRLRLPPLRDRTEDVALLAHVFWRRTMTEVGKQAILAPDALARLASHEWPGNVRELQNVVAGLAVLAPVRGRVNGRHVDQVLADAGAGQRLPPVSLECARMLCERRTVASALARHGGRRSAAARELGLTRQGLTKAIRRLRLQAVAAVEGVA